MFVMRRSLAVYVKKILESHAREMLPVKYVIP